MEERRRAQRYRVWFPMRFEGTAAEAPQAVSKNMSHAGLLMATARQLEQGASVTLIFRLSLDDAEEHRLPGRIVRSEPNGDDPNGLWPYWVAVEFTETAAELEPLIREASNRVPG